MVEQTCYMCDEIATSDEHVPPKCIFPEVKDLGIDYRKGRVVNNLAFLEFTNREYSSILEKCCEILI